MMRRPLPWWVKLAMLMCLFPLSPLWRPDAQSFETLLDWNQPWLFDQTGRELGTEWVSFDYLPDDLWLGPGAGLLGFELDEDAYLNYGRINTAVRTPGSGGPITLYCRTSFSFTGDSNNLMVAATNLIDDGAVFYLNGTEVARFRISSDQTSSTLASDHEASDGALDVFTLTNLSLLRQGPNVMAAEVHQSSSVSMDVLFGMKLVAIRPVPLRITNQPASQVVISGSTLQLAVGVNGTPAAYQWYQNGAAISRGTNAALSVISVTTNTQGDYFVVVTNVISAATSGVAKITVLADTVGPRAIDAVGNPAFVTAPTVAVSFNEVLLPGLSTNPPGNIVLYAGTNYSTPIRLTNILYAFTSRPMLVLFPSDPLWKPYGDYFVLIRRVVDRAGNWSAPDVRVPVRWTSVSNLVHFSDPWEFHDAAYFDPEVFSADPPWYATNYSTASSPWWGRGPGVFFVDYLPPAASCLGAPLLQPIAYQPEPTLFRRSFVVPEGLSRVGDLRLRFIVDDGMVLFLNGRELARYNMGPGPVTEASIASGAFESVCVSNLLVTSSNLPPGTNVLAAAVTQFHSFAHGADTTFGLEMDFVNTWISPLPPEPPLEECLLILSRGDAGLQLSWNTNFTALELQYQTNLDTRLPWLGVSNQANPFLLPASPPAAFYRLWSPD